MEIRENPFTGEYTLVAPHRLSRPWQPAGFCPFCPGAPETGYGWDVLLLSNRYPVVSLNPSPPYVEDLYTAVAAYGASYVLVETPIHDVDDLSDLPKEQIVKVLQQAVKAARDAERDEKAVYYLFFRNKGREIGVSLTHPHSQIYILPVVPPRVALELENSRRRFEKTGRCPHCEIITRETRRIVYKNEASISFVPYYARWPHEVHIYSLRHVSSLTDLELNELEKLAETLKYTLCAIKKATEKPMPHIMVLHQAPLREKPPYYHMHFEIYGMYRPDGRLKYAAGAEQGAALYTLETTPEETAERLRKIIAFCESSR